RSALLAGLVAGAMVLGIMLLAGWAQALFPVIQSVPSLLLHSRTDWDVCSDPERALRDPECAVEGLRQIGSGTDPSSEGHRAAWSTSLQALKERPLFGHGIGSAGQTALRFNRVGSGGESLYFKFTGELGLLGLFSYLGVFLGVLA